MVQPLVMNYPPPYFSCAEFDSFLQPVSDDFVQNCISNFINETGNGATMTAKCAICAGSFFCKHLHVLTVSCLQEMNKLQPVHPHPAQVLTNGVLLHCPPGALYTNDHSDAVDNVCNSCVSHLLRDRLPPLSLANRMWVGNIPVELKLLTLPRHVFVGRYFPATYIIKLYPKKKEACTWASAGCLSGLRGNVSTYHQNTEDIADMVDDKVLPHPSVAFRQRSTQPTQSNRCNLPGPANHSRISPHVYRHYPPQFLRQQSVSVCHLFGAQKPASKIHAQFFACKQNVGSYGFRMVG